MRSPRNSVPRVLAGSLVVLVALGGVATVGCRGKKGSSAVATDAAPTKPSAPRPMPASFVELARRLDPSVVTIRSSQAPAGGPDLWPFREDEEGPASLGSGVVLDTDGYVLTNAHVIAGAIDVKVVLASGDEFEAKIVGTDEQVDVALLKIEGAKGLVPAPLGDSDRLEVGEWVIAIGNPFGLSHTVTAGIVSAKGRRAIDMKTGEAAPNYYWNFIQTDASINPGNSGGPLIDTAGQVVGINTAIEARGGGIGFAIPIDMIEQILPMLKADGHVTRSWLGVYIHPVTVELARRLGLPRPMGALVADVIETSPAAKAGIERNDVILEFDGKAVDDKTLPWTAALSGVGRTITVTIWRGGEKKAVELETEKMP